jgi:hypothetical protein
MTTINEARETIYQTFVTGWGATSPYTFDNEAYKPDDSNPWVRLAVRNRTSNTDTLGPVARRKQLRSGAIFLQIFIPTNSGVKDADTLVRKFREIFEAKVLTPGTLWVTSVDAREIGPDGESYLVVCEASFTYNDTI